MGANKEQKAEGDAWEKREGGRENTHTHEKKEGKRGKTTKREQIKERIMGDTVSNR